MRKQCGVRCVIQTSLITARPFRYFARCAQHVISTHRPPEIAVGTEG